MLLNEDLHPYGITDAALLDEASDHLGENWHPRCGGQKCSTTERPASTGHDETANVAVQTTESTNANPEVEDPATASSTEVACSCHKSAQACEDPRAHDAESKGKPKVAEAKDTAGEPERLFELTTPTGGEEGPDPDRHAESPNSAASPGDTDSGDGGHELGYADYIPFHAQTVPVTRIIKLLRARARDAVPCGLYEGTWRKIGLSIGHCLDISGRSAETFITTALTAVLGLPKLTRLTRQGAIDFRKLDFASTKTSHLTIDELATIDDALADLDPAMPLARFRKHTLRLIATIDQPEDQAELARKHRRVEFWPNTNGTACLALIGPILEVQALYQRLHAVARAVTRNDLDAFGQQVPKGAVVADDRTLGQLVFDMLSSYTPQLEVQAVLPIDAEDAGRNPGSASAPKTENTNHAATTRKTAETGIDESRSPRTPEVTNGDPRRAAGNLGKDSPAGAPSNPSADPRPLTPPSQHRRHRCSRHDAISRRRTTGKRGMRSSPSGV